MTERERESVCEWESLEFPLSIAVVVAMCCEVLLSLSYLNCTTCLNSFFWSSSFSPAPESFTVIFKNPELASAASAAAAAAAAAAACPCPSPAPSPTRPVSMSTTAAECTSVAQCTRRLTLMPFNDEAAVLTGLEKFLPLSLPLVPPPPPLPLLLVPLPRVPVIAAQSATKHALTVTVPPLGVNLMALLRKLRITCAILKRSHDTVSASQSECMRSISLIALALALAPGASGKSAMRRSTSPDRACSRTEDGWE